MQAFLRPAPPAAPDRHLLRPEEVSQILRVPEREVLRLINAGILAREPLRRGNLVSEQHLRAFLDQIRISHAP